MEDGGYALPRPKLLIRMTGNYKEVAMKPLEERQQREYERHQIIRKAVDTADHIILNGSDGSVEETNYLTSEVARKFMEKALLPFNSAMLGKDLEE